MARTKIPVSLRLDPEIKALGEARANEERRSFAGFLEWLILEDAKRHGFAGHAASPGSPIPSSSRKSGERG